MESASDMLCIVINSPANVAVISRAKIKGELNRMYTIKILIIAPNQLETFGRNTSCFIMFYLAIIFEWLVYVINTAAVTSTERDSSTQRTQICQCYYTTHVDVINLLIDRADFVLSVFQISTCSRLLASSESCRSSLHRAHLCISRQPNKNNCQRMFCE